MATTRAKPLKPAVDAREAVRAATEYCKHLFEDLLISDLSLEEIEPTEDRKYWLITLGLSVPVKNTALPTYLQVPRRKLKVFKVNSQTGEVVAMKMRDA